MPPIQPEIKLLLDNLMAQIQQTQTRADTMQAYIQTELEKVRHAAELDALRNKQAVQEEQIKNMAGDIDELKKLLKEATSDILKNQQDNFKRTIYVQTTLLFLVLSAVITIAVKLLFP
jgi:hypothetical protein